MANRQRSVLALVLGLGLLVWLLPSSPSSASRTPEVARARRQQPESPWKELLRPHTDVDTTIPAVQARLKSEFDF
jgi:hypothetical protein